MNTRTSRANKTKHSKATTSLTRLSTAMERLPSMATARRTIGGWGEDGVRFMKRYPVRAAVGAFALGVALTTVAHRA